MGNSPHSKPSKRDPQAEIKRLEKLEKHHRKMAEGCRAKSRKIQSEMDRKAVAKREEKASG